VTDVFTCIYAATAILAALHLRTATGEGQHVVMALFDVASAIMANQAMNYLATGESPQRMGYAHPNLVPYAVFPCADGFVILATGNDAQYQRLCRILDIGELATHPAYLTNADRIRNRAALTKAIAAASRQWSKADLLAACEAEGVPAGPINEMAEVFADPQIVARGMQIAPGGVPGVRLPVTFSGAELALDRPSPNLGEHDAEVRAALSGK
jgi:crotonobetainyl-CoA:carnitine CoA-transferase CaiB-like acyl-CoA transferase